MKYKNIERIQAIYGEWKWLTKQIQLDQNENEQMIHLLPFQSIESELNKLIQIKSNKQSNNNYLQELQWIPWNQFSFVNSIENSMNSMDSSSKQLFYSHFYHELIHSSYLSQSFSSSINTPFSSLTYPIESIFSLFSSRFQWEFTHYYTMKTQTNQWKQQLQGIYQLQEKISNEIPIWNEKFKVQNVVNNNEEQEENEKSKEIMERISRSIARCCDQNPNSIAQFHHLLTTFQSQFTHWFHQQFQHLEFQTTQLPVLLAQCIRAMTDYREFPLQKSKYCSMILERRYGKTLEEWIGMILSHMYQWKMIEEKRKNKERGHSIFAEDE
jgi:hypothetical protein